MDDETLVLDEKHGYIHQLNQSASFVWLHCDGESSIAEIAKQMAQEYDLDHVAAKKDVSRTMEMFRELNLLRT